MTWFTWVVLIFAFAAMIWGWYQIYGKGGKDGVVSCCGCGQCTFHGECVMVKKTLKKSATGLTNPPEKV